jgi:hypothetical protein
MDRRPSGALSSSGLPTGTSVVFPEENGIVLDKWLLDVCGEEDLQFPSHRRAQYPAYMNHLRYVAKAKHFIANTFEYPSRSGTREVLVLQKTLEALGVEEQLLRRENSQVQETITQVRRMLDERTMGASSIVEEEKAQAAKLAEMRAEQKAKAAAVAAAAAQQKQQQQQQTNVPSSQTPAVAAALRQGYAPLNPSTPVFVVTAPPCPSTPATSAAPQQPQASKADTPLPMLEADDDLSTAENSVSSRSGANGLPAGAGEGNTISALARAARRADYEKKKALSLRYVAEVQSKTQTTAAQRAEMEAQHKRLLAEKDQLDREYEALRTTETLVVARHEEAQAHEHEETALLATETAAYAAEDTAFSSAWTDIEAGNEEAAEAQKKEEEKQEMELLSHAAAPPAVTATTAASAVMSPESSSNVEEPSLADRTVVCHDAEEKGALLDSSALDTKASGGSHHADDTATASASCTPAEHDKSPPEATLNTHRPPSQGSNSVASSSPPASHQPSPVQRALHLSNGRDDDDSNDDDTTAIVKQSTPSVTAAAAAAAATAEKEVRRALLEELRHKLSELGTTTQACRRQLLSTSQTHIGRFRQAQQRLKDWQDMVVRLRTTSHQLRGQVEVIRTVLQDAAARLDKDNTESTYGKQLARLNGLLKERSYEAFEYYMGSGETAAAEMLYDANAEEELRALRRPSPSAAAGGMTPIRGVRDSSSVASSATPTREGSLSSAYHTPGGGAGHMSSNRHDRSSGPNGGAPSSGVDLDAPHKHRSRYELVRHLQLWEAALLADRLAILKAANMVPGPFSGAGANMRKVEGFNVTRCYQELRHLLIQAKPTNGPTAS